MNDQQHTHTPLINWDKGTAYDFFASLYVLHHPDDFGLRSTWAAGVRSRLSASDREILEKILAIIDIPLMWIHELPAPKDAFTALYSLKKMDPETSLVQLALCDCKDSVFSRIIRNVASTGKWTKEDLSQIQTSLKNKHQKPVPTKKVEQMLSTWSKAREYGAKLPSILQTYYNSFFQEEEERINIAIDACLPEIQKKAENLSWLELLEEVSRGIKFKEFIGMNELVLVPSYWITPLVMFSEMHTENDRIILFGARPKNETLIPGEVVPDDLLRALKSLSDPTRLQILRYLTKEKLTQAELSRKLRLRAPTITHHLHELRLAGLVGFDLDESGHYYTAKQANINQVFSLLKDYLEKP